MSIDLTRKPQEENLRIFLNQKGFPLKDVRYSKAQKMLKFTFYALIQQLSSYYVSYSYSEAYKIGSKHTI